MAQRRKNTDYKQTQENIGVTVRHRRSAKNAKVRLYLDFYPMVELKEGNGEKTRWESTGNWYINPEIGKNRIEKDKLKSLMVTAVDRADQLKVDRTAYFNNSHVAKNQEELEAKAEKRDADFKEYYRNHVNAIANLNTRKTYGQAYAAYTDFVEKGERGQQMKHITIEFCKAFKTYLLKDRKALKGKVKDGRITTGNKKLSKNTASLYYTKFRAVVKSAGLESHIEDVAGILHNAPGIKLIETDVSYLTHEEIKALLNTRCKHPELERASLFSILTGLRFGDIRDLKWRNIKEDSTAMTVKLKIKIEKSRGHEQTLELHLNSQAIELLGKRERPDDRIFILKKESHKHKYEFDKWIVEAGIDQESKDAPITFHSLRHTFAYLNIKAGNSIFKLKELMGHVKIENTLIYAKLDDSDKAEAMAKVNFNF
jgi:integrase